MQPQPAVIGARMQPQTGAGSADSELETLTTQAADQAWPHPLSADDLVSALFGCLAAAADVERRSLEQMSGLSDKRSRLNRCDTYLCAAERRSWEERARSWLARRGDVVRALSTEALYSATALQHLLELDAADAQLEAEKRRFSDSYTDGVNNQCLLDASRGRFTVEGEVFHFAQAHVEEAEDAFVARLLDAVRRTTPPALLPRVTSAMSQSGLAALERACLCTVVVSGGKQVAEYALSAHLGRPDAVQVTLRVHRHGFGAYFAGADGDDMDPLPCDLSSSLRKSAVVTFGGEGEIDVVDLEERVDVLRDGQALPASELCRPIPEPVPRRGAQARPSRGLLACVCECARRLCCRGPRQLRELRERT
mmetsp:Transcript_24149/g.61313  ORF Transcript_24149/g.61313 Transcript_24149/m.61313 type:complete len:366 (-) Transcript_24149:2-1099(-)